MDVSHSVSCVSLGAWFERQYGGPVRTTTTKVKATSAGFVNPPQSRLPFTEDCSLNAFLHSVQPSASAERAAWDAATSTACTARIAHIDTRLRPSASPRVLLCRQGGVSVEAHQVLDAPQGQQQHRAGGATRGPVRVVLPRDGGRRRASDIRREVQGKRQGGVG